MNERPKVKTNWPMETQMVQVYTKKKWMEFQDEISRSHGYYVQHASTEDELVVYNAISSESCSSSKPRLLTNDKTRDHISCSCRKFEFEGIPCRHMLAFFRINQIFQLPEKYILKRWTREAKIGVVCAIDDQNINDTSLGSLMTRHSRLLYKASVVVDDASLTDEGTKFLDEQLDLIHCKVKDMISISPTFNEGNQRRTSLDKMHNINDPTEIRTKGCGKRLQSAMEKSALKPRVCHGCGQRGASHDRRNCPILQDGSNIDDHENDNNNANEEDYMCP